MTSVLHGLLLFSNCDHRASLCLTLICLASLNFDCISLPASARHLQRLYKTKETEVSPTDVPGKKKQAYECMIPSSCLKLDLMTDIFLPHVCYFSAEGITKSNFLHLETP